MLGIRNFLNKCVQFFYPPLCPFCREKVEKDGMICADCWPSVSPITAPACRHCAIPLDVAFAEENVCVKCMTMPPEFDECRAVYIYGPLIKRLVLRFKNQQVTALASFMGNKMLAISRDIIDASDYIIPVPLHASRLKKRGFNQATLLAYQIAQSMRHKVKLNLLVRCKNTPSQGTLSRQARHKNLEGAFVVPSQLNPELLKNKIITLIDDVMTTGATLKECANALKKYEIKKVNVVVFSRSIR
jgi:ComF family protein